MFSKMCTTLYIPNSNVQITHFLTYRCYFLTFKYNFSAYEAVSLRDFNLHLLDGWQCWTFLLVAIGWVLFVCSSCLLLRFFSPICFIAGCGPGQQAPSLHFAQTFAHFNHAILSLSCSSTLYIPDMSSTFKVFFLSTNWAFAWSYLLKHKGF